MCWGERMEQKIYIKLYPLAPFKFYYCTCIPHQENNLFKKNHIHRGGKTLYLRLCLLSSWNNACQRLHRYMGKPWKNRNKGTPETQYISFYYSQKIPHITTETRQSLTLIYFHSTNVWDWKKVNWNNAISCCMSQKEISFHQTLTGKKESTDWRKYSLPAWQSMVEGPIYFKEVSSFLGQFSSSNKKMRGGSGW